MNFELPEERVNELKRGPGRDGLGEHEGAVQQRSEDAGMGYRR
jgi:hypothetical protein